MDDKIIVPPIKCQGIKTKLVPFIKQNIIWGNKGYWVEPFLGSGVVVFNIAPKRAILSDTNEHIINFYLGVQNGSITPNSVRAYLEKEGAMLSIRDDDYYYIVRDRFNIDHNPLDFLFLNRACFNGVMRFNRKGGFNVPYNHKPDRFSKAYITKIVNQVDKVSRVIKSNDYKFVVSDWRDSLRVVSKNDYVYLDPPYIGRHADYFNQWSEADADDLANAIKALPSHFAYSMWMENRYRINEHNLKHFLNFHTEKIEHFYHVGSKVALRNSMTEGLILNYG